MSGKIIIILGLIIAIVILGSIALRPAKEGKELLPPAGKEELNVVSPEEKEQIENWIIENNLNQYGDPEDTFYIGGTPLFNEQTSETIDRYEYILRQNPDKPWKR